MKKIKFLLLIFGLFLLTGCTVEYNLEINEDLSVNEKVVATENTNRMKVNTGLGENESVNYLYEMFNRKELNTSISTNKNNDNTVSIVNGYHNTLDDYINNFTSDIVKEANIIKDGDIVTLIFDQSEVLSSTSSRSLIYDEIIVNITVPFKVTENNADSHKKNIYTWNINKDEKLKKIKISFDTKDFKYKKEVKIGKLNFSIRYEFIAIGIILLIILLISLIVFINNKKNNKI